MGSQSQLTPPHSLQENEHPSVVSGCSWHMPERTQSDLAGLPVSSSAHAGKAQRKPGEVPWWNVLIRLPVWVSSLNWCLCLAAAFIPKSTVTHTEKSAPEWEIPVAKVGDEDHSDLGHRPGYPLVPHCVRGKGPGMSSSFLSKGSTVCGT